jgi:cellulose synthase/poly-beta-1,6-N-acetylglucosamine synthase-like glycosyltransferase
LARFFQKKVDKSFIEPTVSIVISAYNEEDCIADKINNLLSLDYPNAKMEIIIGSDGSTDQTNDIVQSFALPNLSFYDYSQRRGKMATINDLVAKAKNEIVVFTDARQSFERNTIRELVANFHDRNIGCVSGELHFKPLTGAGGTAKGINLYWNYEKFLRRCESQFHSMLGATGAIYAIRRELFTPIPQSIVLDDMFVPLKIIEKGFRAVFDANAKAYDIVADNPKEEYRRKARTLYGNYQIFYHFLGLFNPFTSPIAIQLFSHKFLRVVAPFLLILLFVKNILLFNTSFTYKFFKVIQICFYLLAFLGMWTKNKNHGFFKIVSKICYAPYVFCLLNFSALVGFLRFAKHKQTVTWEKARGDKQI